MAEAMDAADMPGLHSKLRKLHRNLVMISACFHLVELIENVLHTLKITLTE